MNQNPYAPPQPVYVPPAAPAGGVPQGQGPQPWEFGEALGVAWRAYGENAAVVIFAPIVAGLIMLIPVGGLFALMLVFVLDARFDAFQMAQFQTQTQAMGLAMQVVMLFVGAFFEAGLVRIWVAAARGESPSFGLLFSGGNRFLANTGLNFLLSLPSMLVSGLLVVAFALEAPGLAVAAHGLNWMIILALLTFNLLGLMFTHFFLVDAELGPIASLKAAWNACEGERGQVFAYLLVAGLIGWGGVLVCGIGLLATLPFMYLAVAVVYTRLTGRGPGRPAYAYPPMPYGGYGGYPPPGYGPPPAGYGPPRGY